MSAVRMGGGGGGGRTSLLDVSGISGITGGNDYNYSDSSGLFRGGAGTGAGGLNNSDRYNVDDKDEYDSSNTGSVKRSSGGERSPGWRRPISGRMAARAAPSATPTAISPNVDAVLASRTASLGLGHGHGRGRAEGQAARTPARARSPMTDSFLLMHGGSSGGDSGGGGIGDRGDENGRAGYGIGRSGAVVRRGGRTGADVGVSREWDARGDQSEGD